MPALTTQLSKTCPSCGGKGYTEARLPFTSARPSQQDTLNLDSPQGVVDKLSTSALLALIECLPYKLFTCARCGAEFKMQSQTSKEQLLGLLASMQPEAHQAPARRKRTHTTPATLITPLTAPEAPKKTVKPPAKPTPPPSAPTKKPVVPEAKPGSPDWEPYHLEHDLDSLFDQFDDSLQKK